MPYKFGNYLLGPREILILVIIDKRKANEDLSTTDIYEKSLWYSFTQNSGRTYIIKAKQIVYERINKLIDVGIITKYKTKYAYCYKLTKKGEKLMDNYRQTFESYITKG